MQIIKPDYYDAFRCLAGSCPDSCCKEWDIQVDEKSAALYRGLSGPLGDRLRDVLTDCDGETTMAITDGRCPMWREDGLCRIQAELGESALCTTCRDFPRLRHDYGDFQEWDLELSCPEAASLILCDASPVCQVEELPGGEPGDYDREAMAVLLRTRARIEEILQDSSHSFGTSLALALLYGCQAQNELDGDAEVPFDQEAALRSLPELAEPGDSEGFLRFFSGLEILTEEWRRRLTFPAPSAWTQAHRAFALYLVRRYYLQAVSDYDLMTRVKLIVISCLTVRLLGGNPVKTAQLYSKEIENCIDNLDALLDGAYQYPAFTDRRLLGMLLESENWQSPASKKI